MSKDVAEGERDSARVAMMKGWLKIGGHDGEVKKKVRKKIENAKKGSCSHR